MILESIPGKLIIIDSFSGEYEFLSNFYPVIIHSSGFNFPTVEHAYQASKTNNYAAWREICSIPANQAGRAKKYGRKVKLRKDWELIKLSVMKRFIMQKFSYSDLKEKLLATLDAVLIEGNYWHDNYWGDCRCKKCQNKEGQNHLGKIIMEARNVIT